MYSVLDFHVSRADGARAGSKPFLATTATTDTCPEPAYACTHQEAALPWRNQTATATQCTTSNGRSSLCAATLTIDHSAFLLSTPTPMCRVSQHRLRNMTDSALGVIVELWVAIINNVRHAICFTGKRQNWFGAFTCSLWPGLPESLYLLSYAYARNMSCTLSRCIS